MRQSQVPMDGYDVPYTTSVLVEGVDRRVVDLTPFGFPEIPVLGMNRAFNATGGADFHRHRECMEITLCTRGCAKFDCDGRVYTLKPGMVFASLPEDIHRLRMNQRGARLYWLFFRFPRNDESVLGLSIEETGFIVRTLRNMPQKLFEASAEVEASFESLFSAYDLGGDDNPVRLFRMRVSILRLLQAVISDGEKAAGIETDRLFMSIIDSMRRNPEADYAESRLTQETGFSPNTVLSRFRHLTGLPPHAFLVKCRIQRAKQLLSKSKRSMTEIAMELRFSSSQHFATRFRQETGMTPRAWRDAHCVKGK